jgi:NADPH:quinone reductase-like Zn-dependent oxidoreductase
MCTSAIVVHSLIDVARLQRGESVLIHSAAGGVGQTAIRLAKYPGAKMLATVSSEKKKRLLIEEYGIKESHIFNSCDYSFADGILRLTTQRGVDVVINSLAGEALRRAWLCVAPFGRFIELGKRDIYDKSGLDMRPFLDNITFSGLDILTQVISYPDRFEAIGNQVVELLSKNAISPLNNLARYSFGEVSKAFRPM